MGISILLKVSSHLNILSFIYSYPLLSVHSSYLYCTYDQAVGIQPLLSVKAFPLHVFCFSSVLLSNSNIRIHITESAQPHICITEVEFPYIHSNAMFSLLLHIWCESCALDLREEYRSRAFEKKVQRKTFGPKREEAKGGCRSLHNDRFHNP